MAAAVLDLRMDDPDGLVCLIASVWVGALADDEEAVFDNTREATKAALQLGAAAGPWHGNLAAVETPENPDFRRRSDGAYLRNRLVVLSARILPPV